MNTATLDTPSCAGLLRRTPLPGGAFCLKWMKRKAWYASLPWWAGAKIRAACAQGYSSTTSSAPCGAGT